MIAWVKAELKRVPAWQVTAACSLLLAGAWVFIPGFLDLVVLMGHRIPQPDIRQDYLLGVLWAVILGLTIWVWPVRSEDKKALFIIWGIKCFVMLVLMLFYEDHYQTDAFNYFAAARHPFSEWGIVNLTGPNFAIGLTIWLHQHSWLDSFHATKVSFGMIGFLAVYIFYRAAAVFLGHEKIRVLFILACFPSILFWSSILGKDPLMLFCIAVYCYGAVLGLKRPGITGVAILVLGVVLSASIRPWMGFVLPAPFLIVTGVTFSRKTWKLKLMTACLLLLLSVFYLGRVFGNFGISSRQDVARAANAKYENFAQGGSSTEKSGEMGVAGHLHSASPAFVEKWPGPVVEAAVEKAVVLPDNPVMASAAPSEFGARKRYKNEADMLLAMPQGMFTALFRPLPGEVRNPFGLLAGLEGAFMLVLFFVALFRMRWQALADPVVLWALLLIIIWASVYAFISFNLGTVCRYRLQILPIFLSLLLYFVFRKDRGTVQ